MARMSKSRFALLGLLTLGPMSGYDLRKLFGQSLIHFWSESYGQIYPILRNLAAEGLVEGRREQAAGRPARTVYAISEAGRQALKDWLALPAEAPPRRNELLLKLFFGRQAGPGVCAGQVRAFREEQRQTLATYGEIERWLTTELQAAPELPYWLLTLRQGQHVARALLDWCEETLAVLEVQPAPAPGPAPAGRAEEVP